MLTAGAALSPFVITPVGVSCKYPKPLSSHFLVLPGSSPQVTRENSCLVSGTGKTFQFGLSKLRRRFCIQRSRHNSNALTIHWTSGRPFAVALVPVFYIYMVRYSRWMPKTCPSDIGTYEDVCMYQIKSDRQGVQAEAAE